MDWYHEQVSTYKTDSNNVQQAQLTQFSKIHSERFYTWVSLTDARYVFYILTGIVSTLAIKYLTHIYYSHSVKI